MHLTTALSRRIVAPRSLPYQPSYRNRSFQTPRGNFVLRNRRFADCCLFSGIFAKQDPLDKDKTLWLKTVHLFLRNVICIHLTRVQMHLFACKDTGGTLVATHRAGSGTDARCTYRTVSCRVVEKGKKTKKQAKKIQATAKFQE